MKYYLSENSIDISTMTRRVQVSTDEILTAAQD
jgi:hypothetical protein